MKYYLIEVVTGDDKVKGKGMYEYDTLKEAVANFHQKLGIAMKSDLYETNLLMVVNSEGGVHEIESYKNTSYTPPEVEEVTE